MNLLHFGSKKHNILALLISEVSFKVTKDFYDWRGVNLECSEDGSVPNSAVGFPVLRWQVEDPSV